MTETRFLRDFTRYVRRHKIGNVGAWLSKRGVESYSALKSWCDNNGMHLPLTEEQCNEKYFADRPLPPATSETKPQLKKKSTSNKPVEPEAWHVPAAERPVKSQSSRVTATKKKQTSKTPKSKKGSRK